MPSYGTPSANKHTLTGWPVVHMASRSPRSWMHQGASKYTEGTGTVKIATANYDHRTDSIDIHHDSAVEVDEPDWIAAVHDEQGKIIVCRTITGYAPYQYLVEVEYETKPDTFTTQFYAADRT